MPLVGKVGRKRPRARIAMAFVYFALTLGAITTIYPFLTMVTTGFKSNTDQNDNKLIPVYWSNDEELLIKYLDDKYSGNASLISSIQNTASTSTDLEAYENFLNQLPPDQWIAGFKTPSNNVTSRMNVAWQAFLKTKYKTVEDVNEAYNEINGAFQQVTPPPERLEDPAWNPKDDQKWADWIAFKKTLPANFRIPITANRLYQEFVKSKYKNQFGDVPADVIATNTILLPTEFEQLTLSWSGKQSADEKAFFATGLPKTFLTSGTIEAQWSNYLAAFVGSSAQSGPVVEPPIAAYEKHFVNEHKKEIRNEFTWRNYLYVLDYILLNGRAVANTVIFCLLTILIQLTVNPMAAYALSRFPMKTTGRILLFLLATMAFPAEVAMIPSFLLLKDLHLLNTFAALVLPAAASGYMIFLLKGFFDSLPQEVFESGQIDGAPEWKMMLKIAFPLSKPVFGYMALLAFMGAYGAFIYAFLVAQSREMWTLMVFIYQLQLTAPKSVTMAAVTLAAIPTLFVFLAAQNVIMRGIVLPGER